jgi:hypothetical protein
MGHAQKPSAKAVGDPNIAAAVNGKAVGTYGDKIQYWAAAVSRRRAAQEVRNVLGPEWKTSVLDWRLTPERLAKLNLNRNSVRKIGFAEAIR